MTTVRLRIRYAKRGKVVWTSHRDVARIWERGLRRAGVRVAYSLGFSPRPKLSFGLALPTGYGSEGEYLDVDVDDPGHALDDLAHRLTETTPVGFEAQVIGVVGPGTPSLQQDVVSCTWRLTVEAGPAGAADDAIEGALSASSLVLTRTRKGRELTEDIRPGIEHLAVVGSDDGAAVLHADLATQPRGLRPAELLAACFPAGGDHVLRHGVRLHQWIERDGTRREPLPLTLAPPHALGARA